METAVDLLRQSITLAKEYDTRSNKKITLLQSHAKALEEDIQFLLTYKEPNKMFDKATADVLAEARVTRREIERQVIDLLPAATVAASSSSSETASSAAVVEKVATAMLLPQAKLPTFDGDPARFRLFYDTFVDTVQNNTSVADMTKWVHLKNCLQGAAADLIREIPQTPTTLGIALRMLHDTYGSEERAVTELYTKLQNTEPATTATHSLRVTYAKVEGILMSLEQYGHEVNADGYLRSVVLGKYPSDVVFTVMAGQKLPLKQIREKLSEYIVSRECTIDQIVAHPSRFVAATAQPQMQPRGPTTSSRGGRGTTGRGGATTNARTPRCIFCEGDHWSDQCTKYASLEERRKKVASRCQKCLRFAHPNVNCATERRCFHCDAFDHNRALCPKKFQTPIAAAFTALLHGANVDNEMAASNWRSQVGEYWTLLAQIRSEKVTNPITVRVLLDPGSPTSLITNKIASELQLTRIEKQRTKFLGMNNTELQMGVAIAEQPTLRTQKNEEIAVGLHAVEYIAGNLDATDIARFRRTYPQYGGLHIPEAGHGREIDLLLGGDNLLKILRLGSCVEVDREHQLLATEFGHVIVTAKPKENKRNSHLSLFTQMETDIKWMWELDAIGLRYVEESDEKEELEAIQKFYDNIKFVNGRYEIAWPWKFYPPLLDTNYGLALGRLRSLYKQLKNKPQLLQDYHAVITQQVNSGIAEAVQEKWPKQDAPMHYLPHHPIVKIESSTKVRPVYDASVSGVAKGNSLNQNMLKGTKWLTDLVNILFRFRTEKTAIVSDIERAFHQIAVREQDRDVVRFLWLKDIAEEPTDDNIQIYRFTRVAFGIVSSPFLLSATIHYHAEKQPNEFTQQVLQNLYADNLVVTIPDATQPQEFYETTKEFFTSMGMNLTKWSTNNQELMACIPEKDQQQDIIQPVLGLAWNRLDDTMRLKKPRLINSTETKLTKRKVLSQAASVYDPLGWAAPITLIPKLFIRQLWNLGAEWDTKIKETYNDIWQQILTEISQVDRVGVSRQMFPNADSNEEACIEVHTFTDASADAVAVVVYAIRKTKTTIQSAFVGAKNKLSPKSKLTIPRLELLAVLLGCRYTKFVVNALQWGTAKTVLWSDSRCALAWVNSPRLLPPIIQRQVTEIRQQNIRQFNYVPSELNRADVASRGATYLILKEQDWWTAPDWLAEQANWPLQQIAVEIEEIINEEAVFLVQRQRLVPDPEDNSNSPFNISIADYSELSRLLRQTAYCISVLNAFAKREILPVTTKRDYNLAKLLWIKWDQRRYYKEANGKEENQPFTLSNIRVFIDSQGIIRCLSRTQNADRKEEQNCPILLAKSSKLTKLLILNKHTLNYHAGTAHTLTATRKTYWIPQGRRQIYSTILHECYKCRRQIAQTYPNPPPNPLPEIRVTQATQPFEGTALDICGPFKVRAVTATGHTQTKRWILVLTCTRIRAVHLEVLENMTTVEILQAFRRFTARRGTPKVLISDNAANFTALDGMFQKLWPTVRNSQIVSEYFATTGIEWRFLTPESPWMGGVHERIVQMVKSCLEKTYGDRIMLDRQFGTTVIEIESVINSRPLTYVDQHLESKIITPNDFLRARFAAIPLDAVPADAQDPILHLWKSSQKYADEFWQYWSKMYITELRERDDRLKNKPRNTKLVPQKGELVILAEPEKKRSAWQLAVIERLIKSSDGAVRSAQLRLPNGTRVIRAVIKIAPLGVQMQLPGVEDEQLSRDRRNIEVQRKAADSQADIAVQPGSQAANTVSQPASSPEGTSGVLGNAGGSSSSQSTSTGGVSDAGEFSNPPSQGSQEVIEVELDWTDDEDTYEDAMNERPDD